MFTVSDLFALAVQVEENGEEFYRYALGKVQTDSLRDLLGWLADQESQHRNCFTETKERLAGKISIDPSLPVLSTELLRSAMGRHAFSLDELQIDSLEDEGDLLRAALLFEEDTIHFFEFIESFISDPEAMTALEKIKAEESNHIRVITDRISETEKRTLSRKS